MKKIFLTNKEKLTEFFVTEKEGFKLIEKYEENADFFEDLSEKGSIDDILLVISIKINKYANPLITNGYYTKAFKVLEKVETDLKKVKEDAEWYEFYSEQTAFWKAVCLGRLKKYRESNQYFKELLNKNPTNDNYLDWYKSNKKHQMERIMLGIIIVGVAIYLLCIIINSVNFLNLKIPKIVETLTMSIYVTALIIMYIWGKVIDKQRKRIKQRAKAENL